MDLSALGFAPVEQGNAVAPGEPVDLSSLGFAPVGAPAGGDNFYNDVFNEPEPLIPQGMLSGGVDELANATIPVASEGMLQVAPPEPVQPTAWWQRPLPPDASEREQIAYERINQLATELPPGQDPEAAYNQELVNFTHGSEADSRIVSFDPITKRVVYAGSYGDPVNRLLDSPVPRGLLNAADSVVTTGADWALGTAGGITGDKGLSDMAEYAGRQRELNKSYDQGLNERQGKVGAMAAQVTEMMAKYTPIGAVGGMGALLPYIYAESTTDALNEGKRAGLGELDAQLYAHSIGAINAGFTALGGAVSSKLGVKTFEELVSSGGTPVLGRLTPPPNSFKALFRGLGRYAQSAGVETLAEEFPTYFAENVARYASGLQDDAVPETMWRDLTDIAAASAIMSIPGGLESVQEGPLTAQMMADMGIPPATAKSQADRDRISQVILNQLDEIEQQQQQPPEAPQTPPDAPEADQAPVEPPPVETPPEAPQEPTEDVVPPAEVQQPYDGAPYVPVPGDPRFEPPQEDGVPYVPAPNTPEYQVPPDGQGDPNPPDFEVPPEVTPQKPRGPLSQQVDARRQAQEALQPEPEPQQEQVPVDEVAQEPVAVPPADPVAKKPSATSDAEVDQLQARLDKAAPKAAGKVKRISPKLLRIEFPGGHAVDVQHVSRVPLEGEALKKALSNYGIKDTPENRQWMQENVGGLFQLRTKDGKPMPVGSLITMRNGLDDADATTILRHELLHFARQAGLISDEAWSKVTAALAKGKASEGAQQEAINAALQYDPSLLEKIRDMLDAMLEAVGLSTGDVRRLKSELRSGEVFNKKKSEPKKKLTEAEQNRQRQVRTQEIADRNRARDLRKTARSIRSNLLKEGREKPAATSVEADMVLDATDLGEGTDKDKRFKFQPAYKRVKQIAAAAPEFAYEPVFTVNAKKQLVYKDGVTYTLDPALFNLHPSELKEGQTVGINLEDIGLKRLSGSEAVAQALKNDGFKVRRRPSGEMTASWGGFQITVAGKDDAWEAWPNGSSEGGDKAVKQAKQTLKKMHFLAGEQAPPVEPGRAPVVPPPTTEAVPGPAGDSPAGDSKKTPGRKLYQGRGFTPEQIYGEDNVKEGRGVPLFGPGEYYAPNAEDAKNYGDQITEHEVALERPFVLDSDEKLRKLLEAADATHLYPDSEKHWTEPKEVAKATVKVQQYLKSKGYDGIDVKLWSSGDPNKYDPDWDRTTKMLRQLTGHDQTVVFPSDVRGSQEGGSLADEIDQQAQEAGYTGEEEAPHRIRSSDRVDLESIPEDLSVEIEAVRAKTGEKVKVTKPAKEVISRLSSDISAYKKLIHCLGK